jgi:glycosyltransferase involved in cell wall biosynthesis
MSKIQVFIATHNRPKLVLNAINSVLNQDFDSFEVIVSDNSSNDETENLISIFKNKQLTYKRRKPSMSATDHLNSILKEVTSEYFMIFHDDDMMHRDMINVLYSVIANNDKVIAVGSNANIIKNGKRENRNFNRRLKRDIKIYSIAEMVFAYSIPSFVPFPSYLYRKEVAQRLRINDEQGGKHADAAFIINILTLGSVIFIARPLMDYNVHSNQDSIIYDFRAFSKLISFIARKMGYHRNQPLLKRMRIQNIYGETKFNLLNQNLSTCSIRYFTLCRILLKYSTFEYFLKIVMITIYCQFIKMKKFFKIVE